MKRFRKFIKLAGMFLLLFALVSLPLLYTEYHNSHLLNHIALSPVQTVSLEKEADQQDQYDMWARLENIDQAVVIRAVEFHNREQETEEEKQNLLRRMEEQLASLHRYGCLPELDFAGAGPSFICREIYLESDAYEDHTAINRADLSVSVWNILVDYEDFYVQVYMDAETSALYDVMLLSKEKDFVYRQDSSADQLMEYLKSFSELPPEKEWKFTVQGYYTEKTVKLSLILPGNEPHGFNDADSVSIVESVQDDSPGQQRAGQSTGVMNQSEALYQ